ncbi:phage tail tube protein [Pseudomonas oryzihabitans]|uniref:phage tail tube protein n=1 Tax=Pseudomonas oryzihabitans TaxID=47885 RepID=UPI0011A38AA3|nr:hypothetical protein [Pseudomonas oryzihabitans]
MALQKETFVVGGLAKMRRYGKGGAFLPLGLVSTIKQTISTKDLTLADTTTPQGGEYDSASRIESMGLTMNWREFGPRNLGIMHWGSVERIPSADVASEEVTAEVGGTLMLKQMPLSITSVTLKATPTTTFKADEDFIMTGAGIEVLDGGKIKTNDVLLVSYKGATVDIIQTIVNSGEEYSILFEGASAVGSQKRVNLLYHRVKFKPSASFDWISTEDFMGGEMEGKCLADPRQVGAGKSRYLKITKEAPDAV